MSGLDSYLADDFFAEANRLGCGLDIFIWPSLPVYEAYKNHPRALSAPDIYFSLAHEEELRDVQENFLRDYVENPCRAMVRFLWGKNRITLSSNAYGPGAKEVIWIYPREYFSDDFANPDLTGPYYCTALKDGATKGLGSHSVTERGVWQARDDLTVPSPCLPQARDYTHP